MTDELLNAWLHWLDSRPAGYSKRYLWELKRGSRTGADLRSPLSWLADHFIAAHPDRARWEYPDPVQGRFNYQFILDGTEYNHVLPRDVFHFAGLDEGSIVTVTELAGKGSSHTGFAGKLRALTVTVRGMK